MMDSFLASAFFGTAMPLELTGMDLAARLGCALIASAVIGYNRSEQGKVVGLRTTILVCLAAAVAMLQMNYLLPLSGRPSNSFIMNDLMRLPLGILTGVGFIGGGAILRRGDIVVGVTTAATLWFVTVVGLCFGGGQVLLGWAATALGCVVLWGLKWLETVLAVRQYARLTISIDGSELAEAEIRQLLTKDGIEIRDVGLITDGPRRTYVLNLRNMRQPGDTAIPKVIENLGHRAGVTGLQWRHLD
jgi:putative Mg2+ transporter-C (MgtC) family protein